MSWRPASVLVMAREFFEGGPLNGRVQDVEVDGESYGETHVEGGRYVPTDPPETVEVDGRHARVCRWSPTSP